MHISDFTAIVGNPAKQFLWEVVIPALPLEGIKAVSTQLPGVSTTDIDLWHMGQLAKFPGTVEYEHTWNCSIVESESGSVWNAMFNWHQLIFAQNSGIMADISAIKRDVTIRLLTSANSPYVTIILKGAYPKSIDTIELDKSANTEAIKFNLIFNYDYWLKG